MSLTQRALAARRPAEKRKPALIARAKVGNGWQSIGAAWPLKSGEEGLSVKLNAIPVDGWNGQFVLLPPLPNQEVPQVDEPDAA